MIPDDFFGNHFGSISGALSGLETMHKVIPKWGPARNPQFSISYDPVFGKPLRFLGFIDFAVKFQVGELKKQ